MRVLTVQEFGAFFEELWGYEPFPWQARFVAEAWAAGRFPSLVDLPTGAGKTSVLDAAVYLMAMGAQEPVGSDRRFPRRVLLVVDRRVIVDQASARARALSEAMASPPGPVCRRVAERLGQLAGLGDPHPWQAGVPLAWAQLRGGMAREDGWARHPAQPLVGASTVDQVGSRLLFRGYGVSDGAKPIHAGLLGEDTALFLDEVHLSQPFRDTLRTLAELRSRATWRAPTSWQVVEMSATPGDAEGPVFRLAEADRCHPVLARRLSARKPCSLVVAGKLVGKEPRRRMRLAEEVAGQARAVLEREAQVRTLLVVVNRVDTARGVWRALQGAEIEVALLTGRSRPVDREQVLGTLWERIRAGRARDPSAPPLVVVATQCVEAGADLDFDGLVTECASLDALRQRFGRVDRLGEMTASGSAAVGVVVIREDQLDEAKPDPIYGSALARTYGWLRGQESPDFGADGMGASPQGLGAPKARAPELLGGHMDLWSQTRPRPHADPNPALWLHGLRSSSPDVQVAWRSELDLEDLSDEGCVAAVAACPPGSPETVPLPIWAARAWLWGQAAPGPSDVEGAAPEEVTLDDEAGRRVVVWRGDGSEVVREARAIRPGDTLVVPCGMGGLGPDGNWDPEATTPVEDVGDRIQLRQRGRPVMRLHEGAWPGLSGMPRPGEGEEEEQTDRDRLDGFLSTLNMRALDEQGAAWRREVMATFARSPRRVRAFEVGDEGGERWWVIRGPKRDAAPMRGVMELPEFGGGDESASFTSVSVPLEEHLVGVGAWSAHFATACGLSEELVQTLRLAGELHDLGKADPRFQAMLWRGDVAITAAQMGRGVFLAKSAMAASNRGARARAARLSGWPVGGRHELMSVALVVPELERLVAERLGGDAELGELLLHLVESHHGWCRPFPPAVVDEEDRPVRVRVHDQWWEGRTAHGQYRLSAGSAGRFWRLTERYGWWGLAWLETLLRLADHRRSAWESSTHTEGGVR